MRHVGDSSQMLGTWSTLYSVQEAQEVHQVPLHFARVQAAFEADQGTGGPAWVPLQMGLPKVALTAGIFGPYYV